MNITPELQKALENLLRSYRTVDVAGVQQLKEAVAKVLDTSRLVLNDLA